MERGSIWRPNVEIAPSCPRCGSSNTKFCYYNNYSLTQPRYFCKGCRRYWTKGGSLRNVPVGGGCRKSRRGKSSMSNNSNGKNLTNCYNNSNNRGESSGSGGSNIDLALVYANFLNPRPDDNPNSDIPHGDHHLDSNSGLLPQLEIPTSLPGLSPEITNHTLFSAFEPVNSNNNQENGKIQVQVQECNLISQGMTAGSYGLPPLPGEETVLSINHLHQESFVWSDTVSLENHHGVDHVQTVQEPVQFGDGTEDPANLLFGNWSPFDFSSDDTFFRT